MPMHDGLSRLDQPKGQKASQTRDPGDDVNEFDACHSGQSLSVTHQAINHSKMRPLGQLGPLNSSCADVEEP